MYKCQYCEKEIGNKGCLVLHERNCVKNPNHELSKTQKMLLDRDNRRDENGNLQNIGFGGRHHTNETKNILALKRKEWLKNNKDKHAWKRNSKFISIPCENLKNELRKRNINFVEEYQPFDDVNYCLDIAWPDEMLAIEVNGNQHYNNDGTLRKYYYDRHKLLEKRGWKIIEIHYTKCYNISIIDLNNILKLPIYDKNYVGKYFSKKEKINFEKNEKENLKNKLEISRKNIIFNLINNSGIDFSKKGWSSKAIIFLKNRNELWNKGIFRCIRKYFPEFLKREDVWKRKGSKI